MNISCHNTSVKMLIFDQKGFRLLLTFMLILFTLVFVEVTDVQAQAGFLPEAEMASLKHIAKELRKNDWNFNLNPCDNASNWNWRTEKRKCLTITILLSVTAPTPAVCVMWFPYFSRGRILMVFFHHH